jgi:hypothetical protein
MRGVWRIRPKNPPEGDAGERPTLERKESRPGTEAIKTTVVT